MAGLDGSYIKNIDTANPKVEGSEDLGILAEGVIIEYFNKLFPGQITVRHATKEEDSGVKQIVSGKQIDAVAYDENGIATMCMQITTARDPNVRREKLKQLMDHPFIRLQEMTLKDSAIPKVLVNLDPVEARLLLDDHDFTKHPKASEQILESTIQSLKFVLTTTKAEEERQRIQNLINIFETKKGESH